MSRTYDFACKTLFTEAELHSRTRLVAQRIAADYRDKNLQYLDNPLVLICVLKGSLMFTADLARMLADLGVPTRMEFICVSSYGDGVTTSGQVRMLLDTRHSVEGKHVLIVEDIVDSAITLQYICRIFATRRPASLRTVVLLDKPKGRKVSFTADYVVTEVPHEFVIGYGLDYDEAFREIRDIVVMKPSFYEETLRRKEQRIKMEQESKL